MKSLKVSNQNGAVLIFSLMMLLLLTVVSVSMIQQNKQELVMTGNTLEQTRTLSRAESELALVEQEIDKIRLDNKYDINNKYNVNYPSTANYRKCNSAANKQIDKDQEITLTPTPHSNIGKATILGVYCLINDEELECTYTGGVRDSKAACQCSTLNGTEIYAVQWVSSATENYGSQRVVESKYAVDCIKGTF